MMTLREAWLVSFGVAMSAMGVTLMLGEEVYSSTSYYWIFYYVPSAVWGLIFAGVGAFAISAGIAKSHYRAQMAFGASSLITFMWAAGYTAALFTDRLGHPSGLIVWVLLSAWNLLCARSLDEAEAVL